MMTGRDAKSALRISPGLSASAKRVKRWRSIPWSEASFSSSAFWASSVAVFCFNRSSARFIAEISVMSARSEPRGRDGSASMGVKVTSPQKETPSARENLASALRLPPFSLRACRSSSRPWPARSKMVFCRSLSGDRPVMVSQVALHERNFPSPLRMVIPEEALSKTALKLASLLLTSSCRCFPVKKKLPRTTRRMRAPTSRFLWVLRPLRAASTSSAGEASTTARRFPPIRRVFQATSSLLPPFPPGTSRRFFPETAPETRARTFSSSGDSPPKLPSAPCCEGSLNHTRVPSS